MRPDESKSLAGNKFCKSVKNEAHISHCYITIPHHLCSLCYDVAYGHILRLPCLTYGNFSIVKTDHKLSGHVLETFKNLSADECEDECLEHRLCKSINTKNATGVNCELNSKSTEDPFDNAMISTIIGWTYKTTNNNAKNVS